MNRRVAAGVSASLTTAITLSACGATSMGSTAAAAESKTQTEASARTEQFSAPELTLTVSRKDASRTAESYLSHAAFSRSGLIEQLKYEEFSEADATFGADSLNANWEAQAAKSAASYLSLSPVSRSGLIQQLRFEGFTSAQSKYGADSVGP